MTGQSGLMAMIRLPRAVPVLVGKRTEVACVILVRTATELRIGALVGALFYVILRLLLLGSSVDIL